MPTWWSSCSGIAVKSKTIQANNGGGSKNMSRFYHSRKRRARLPDKTGRANWTKVAQQRLPRQSVSGTGACLRTTISDLMDSLYHVELNLSCEGQLCWETRRTVEAGWPLLLLLRIWPVDLSQPQGLVLTARPNVTVTNIIILINANTKIIIPRNASLMMD